MFFNYKTTLTKVNVQQNKSPQCFVGATDRAVLERKDIVYLILDKRPYTNSSISV